MSKLFQYKYDELFNPTIQALKNLGGSASISEIEDEVSKILNLSDEEINDIRKGSRIKLSYRLAWARTYLKNDIEKSLSRGLAIVKVDAFLQVDFEVRPS